MSDYQLRKRSSLLATATATGSWYYPATGDSGPFAESPKRFDFVGRQETLSRGNPVGKLGSGNTSDIGGNFLTKRLFWGEVNKKGWPSKPAPLKMYNLQGSGFFVDRTYTPLLPKPLWMLANAAWDAAQPSSDDFLLALGSRCVANVKPTNSAADLAVAIAELKREGIPTLIGLNFFRNRARELRAQGKAVQKLDPTKPVKDLGDEYLNFQFGWSPLVSDLMKAVDATSKSEKIWRQYKRDSGRLVRRRMKLPLETQVVDDHVTANWPVEGLVTDSMFVSGRATGTLHETTIKTTKRWFEGGFTYYVPDNPLLAAASKARKLYGLTLDPEVLWNLAPWSWLVDWHGTIGSGISNLTDLATDGLVMRYGYMMEETTVRHESTLKNIATRSGGPSSVSAVATCVVKRRIAASPYGFGLTWESYSPRQLSILAALGITRRR